MQLKRSVLLEGSNRTPDSATRFARLIGFIFTQLHLLVLLLLITLIALPIQQCSSLKCMHNSHPRSQPQDELGSLLETHQLRNGLCHHGDKLLHFPVQLQIFLPYDLPYVRVCQLQRGGHQAKGGQGKDTCATHKKRQ